MRLEPRRNMWRSVTHGAAVDMESAKTLSSRLPATCFLDFGGTWRKFGGNSNGVHESNLILYLKFISIFMPVHSSSCVSTIMYSWYIRQIEMLESVH